MSRKNLPKISGAVSGPASDNAAYQILCKSHFPVVKPTICSDSRTETEYAYKTVALGLASPAGSCVSTTILWPKNPLKQIVARTPVSVPIQGAYSTTYYLDTLACGHQVAVFPQNDVSGKKRHRCVECGGAQLALKFKPQSFPSPEKKKRAA